MSWLYIYLLSCFPLVPAVIVTVREDIDRIRNPRKYANSKFGPNWKWGEFCITQYYCTACLIPVLNLYCWYIMLGIITMDIRNKLRP